MEKIYDESQQQQRKKQNKKFKIDGVSMLAFAVAIFAVVSLIAAGVSGFSFALPNNVVTLPDSFTGVEDDDIEMGDYATNQMVFYHYYQNGGTNIPLICLQRKIDFNPGSFTKVSDNGVASEDVGLLYLLANLAPNATITYPTDGFTAAPSGRENYMDFWVSQMAVWYYLATKQNPDTTNVGEAEIGEAPNANWVYIGDDFATFKSTNPGDTCSSPSSCFGYLNNEKKLFDEIKVNGVSINQLITNAKAKSGIAYSISLSDGDGAIKTDDAHQYFFSPLYTVVSSIDNSVGELTTYSLNVTAKDQDGNTVDVNPVITDAEGNVKNDVSALTPSQLSTFYVRIPADKVDKNITVNVGINGTFRMYDGLRYKTAGDYQEVTTVQFVSKTTSSGKSFDLAPAPDTGISAGQTIYFVGLIVLLCGVGIIYANAKPAKAQN